MIVQDHAVANELRLESAQKAYLMALGENARAAKVQLAQASTAQKNEALRAIAAYIAKQQPAILKANAEDVSKAMALNISAPLIDRLRLTPERIANIIAQLTVITELADPVGNINHLQRRPNGMQVGKLRVPIGVIAIIYESRPNVTVDAAALCIKSGNAVILRGGKESLQTNKALYQAIKAGISAAGLSENSVQFIESPERGLVNALIQQTQWLDLLIPRGGRALIETLTQYAKVPVLKHLDGNCHVYVDQYANLSMAEKIATNAKTYRFGICGAMETLLIHREIAANFLPLAMTSFDQAQVRLKGCAQTRSLLKQLQLPAVELAAETDWYTEYLGPQLAVKIVENIKAAIEHINQYGSHHSDAIVTDSLAHSQQFLAEVDSSSVMVNVPTCFADGAEYGLGAEIGISTDKLHARGPVGLEGLTTQKYIVLGAGQLRG